MSVATTCASGNSREHDGQASASRAGVGDGQRPAAVAQELDRGFDDQLGGRARDEHGRRDLEVEIPEFLPAGDVGDRLARGARLATSAS